MREIEKSKNREIEKSRFRDFEVSRFRDFEISRIVNHEIINNSTPMSSAFCESGGKWFRTSLSGISRMPTRGSEWATVPYPSTKTTSQKAYTTSSGTSMQQRRRSKTPKILKVGCISSHLYLRYSIALFFISAFNVSAFLASYITGNGNDRRLGNATRRCRRKNTSNEREHAVDIRFLYCFILLASFFYVVVVFICGHVVFDDFLLSKAHKS